MRNSKEILVYADWQGLKSPEFIGTLFSTFSRGKEIFSFEYDKKWLQSPFVKAIDPDLGLYSGVQYLRDEKLNFGAWEMITYELAQAVGLKVEKATAKKFYGRHHTFLIKRFDRTDAGRRLHFASAMTLLGYTDGVSFQDGASYLELAEFIVRRGANINRDLEELFRRIVFSICVSNTDDHLRNHGFLLTNHGWTLSPAYDINPNPRGVGLKLNISEHDNSLNTDLAMEVAPFFRLTNNRATDIIKNTAQVVSNWKKLALKYRIPREEQDRMSAAFRV